MRRADESTEPLRAKALRASAKSMLKKLRGRGRDDFHVQMSLGKLAVSEIERVMKGNVESGSLAVRQEIIRLIGEAEREFGAAEKSGSRGPSVAKERSRLRRILNEHDESIRILESALESDPDSRRVAVAYNDAIRKDDPEKGRAAIEKALISHPNDKMLNQSLFLSLVRDGDQFADRLEGPLLKSFTLESDNILMHIHALKYYFGRRNFVEYERVLAGSKEVQQRLLVSNKPLLEIKAECIQSGLMVGYYRVYPSLLWLCRLPAISGQHFFVPLDLLIRMYVNRPGFYRRLLIYSNRSHYEQYEKQIFT